MTNGSDSSASQRSAAADGLGGAKEFNGFDRPNKSALRRSQTATPAYKQEKGSYVGQG